MVFKAVNPLLWCIFSKTSISPRRNYNFWDLWEFSTYSTWHDLIPVLVTATLRVLPRTFADLDCLRYNASTTWTHGKFQRTYNSVAWRMSGKFQITYREACPSSASSHERYYMPHPTPPHPCIHAPTGSHREACPSSASSHERYYMPHPTPTHPTPPHSTPPHPTMCTKHHGLLKAVVHIYIYILHVHVNLSVYQ